jgi:hypothetical protein
MPVHKGKNCVSEEMHRWGQGELHSGVGKKGAEGKVVPKGKAGQKQALAIAISECNHSERLQSIGYSEETAKQVAEMLDFANVDWQKQFDTGKGPGPEKSDNIHTGLSTKKGRGNLFIGETGVKGNMGKQKVNNDSEMLSPASYPRGPGNPQGGSSKEVFGLRMLG